MADNTESNNNVKSDKSNKRKKHNDLIWFLPEVIAILIVVIVIAALYRFYDMLLGACVERCAFSVMIIAVLGYTVRKQFPVRKNLEDAAYSSLNRFWIVYFAGIVFSVLSIFIPQAAWPFTGFFVVLGVFSSPLIGCLGGTSLVLIAAVLTGCKAGIVILYTICGALGIAAFFPIKEEIKIFRPLILTLVGQFACEMTGIILSSSSMIAPGQFLLPGLNLIITGIIIFAGIRVYALRIKYTLRDRYQILNDTEYHLLARTRENDSVTYKHLIHTSYFTERIAAKLGMNVEALKCAGLYYRLCPLDATLRNEFFESEDFPGSVKEILTEYTDFIAKRTGNRLKTRECAVLLYSHTIILAIMALYDKNSDADLSIQIDKLIDAAFIRYEKNGVFSASNLTYNDVRIMLKIFKDEKLYYELLH